jgi:hypothetical protein
MPILRLTALLGFIIQLPTLIDRIHHLSALGTSFPCVKVS